MKKLVLGLSLLGVTSLFADYQLTLIDKDGVETNQCIKSYSFSNNLESLARKNDLGLKDVYSEEETMTNKVYMGKPVYRKVLSLDDFTVPYSVTIDKYSTPVDNVEEIIKNDFSAEINGAVYTSSASKYVMYSTGNSQVILTRFIKSTNQAEITLKQNHATYKDNWNVSKFKFILEYTKTTDTANSSSNTFKSYLHYVPSSSSTEELISVDLKDTGVRFLEGYTYDSTTDSCTKN